MSDLETRLAEALNHVAEAAPAAAGLADAARSRARSKRRAKVVGAAAAVAVCLGVPTAVVAEKGPQDARPATNAHRNLTPAVDVPAGYRVESWHDVSVLVPTSWEDGSLSDWCAGGGALTYRVQRPGAPATESRCPSSAYGLGFQALDGNDETFDWPVALQTGTGWPPNAWVGAHGTGGVLVQVTAPTRQEALAVLATVRRIGSQGDPYGCTSSRGEAPPLEVPTGAMRICRYDDQGLLEQSELLVGDDVAKAVDALEEAPELISADRDCALKVTEIEPVVRLHTSDVHANVDLGGACPLVHGLGADRQLTPDVLYWALSPGWSGDSTNLPLPPELRQQ
jgi:hypothetical protein